MTKRIASILFAALMLGGLLAGCGSKDAFETPAASASTPQSSPAPTAEPTPTPDPETVWAQAGKDTMAWLQSQPGFEGLDLTVQEGFPYFLAVNRDANTVTVYTADENGQYTKPYMAMVCSGGTDTPTGYWNTPVNYDWRLLSGPCYAGPTCSTRCPTTPSTRTIWNTTSSTSWGPPRRWAASVWLWWMCAGSMKTAPSAPRWPFMTTRPTPAPWASRTP